MLLVLPDKQTTGKISSSGKVLLSLQTRYPSKLGLFQSSMVATNWPKFVRVDMPENALAHVHKRAGSFVESCIILWAWNMNLHALQITTSL